MVTGTSVRIRHVAACPEIDPLLCAEQDIPEHWHDQHIAWLRLDPTLNVGLGAGWQASVGLPFDVRAIAVDYETPDGAVFDPPYADIHHRDETLWGPTDGTALVRKYATVGTHAIVGVGLGTTLPIGRTEADPYALTEEGLTHQHIQLGTGTFVPVATLEGVLTGARWGGTAWVSGRLPLYANTEGYRPGATVTGGLGPSWRPIPAVQLLATVEGSFEGAEAWSGTTYGSRATGLAGVTGIYGLSDSVVLQAQARVTALSWSGHPDADEGSAVQRFLGTVGVSWSFDPGKKLRRDRDTEGETSGILAP
ncbi:MAG: hypothetical protein Q8P41_12660 [Pseudomonadota bacterium]|nr:hypothetical protein [Pseudomonadota bacterium]